MIRLKDDRFPLIMIIVLVCQRKAYPLMTGKSLVSLAYVSVIWMIGSAHDNFESSMHTCHESITDVSLQWWCGLDKVRTVWSGISVIKDRWYKYMTVSGSFFICSKYIELHHWQKGNKAYTRSNGKWNDCHSTNEATLNNMDKIGHHMASQKWELHTLSPYICICHSTRVCSWCNYSSPITNTTLWVMCTENHIRCCNESKYLFARLSPMLTMEPASTKRGPSICLAWCIAVMFTLQVNMDYI